MVLSVINDHHKSTVYNAFRKYAFPLRLIYVLILLLLSIQGLSQLTRSETKKSPSGLPTVSMASGRENTGEEMPPKQEEWIDGIQESW
jgi:hypothetical protein